MIALDWASRFPNDFVGAVLINSSCTLSPPWYRMQPLALWELAKAGVRSVQQREATRARLLCNVADPLREWIEIAHKRPVSLATELRQLIAALCFRAPKALTVPLLLLVSDKDRLARPSCSVKIASTFGGRAAVHPEAGHDIATDAPAWVLERSEQWANTVTNKMDDIVL